MIIVTRTFQQKEYRWVRKIFTFEDIVTAIKRFTKGIRRQGESEFSNFGIKDAKVVKLRVGRRDSGRLIILLLVRLNYIFPLLIRQKADKKGGRNISAELMEKELASLIDNVLSDYKQGKFTVID